MDAVRYWVAIDVRRRWRSFGLAALLLGVIGAGAIGCLTAAERTESAHGRLLAATNAADVAVEHGVAGSEFSVDGDLIEALPQVKSVGRGRPLLAGPVDEEGLLDPNLNVGVLSSGDGRLYYDIGRPRIIEGTMPDPSRLDEALVNTAAAELLGIGLGDTFGIRLAGFDDLPRVEQGDFSVGTLVELRVSGIAESSRGEFYSMGANPAIITTPALARAHPESHTYGVLLAELKRGDADVVAFTKSLEALSGTGSAAVHSRSDTVREFARTTGPYATAWLAASIALVVVLGATAVQVLGRLTSGASDELTVSAIGMTKAQRRLAIGLRALLVATSATILATGLAVASSTFTLIGPASDLEPNRGVRVAWLLLTGSSTGVFLVLVAAPFLHVSVKSRRAGLVADLLARLNLPFAVVTGARLARPGLAPSRSALVGTAAGLLLLAGAATFGTSLDRVLSTPALYGNDFDARVGNAYRSIPAEETERVLDRDPAVASYSREIVEGVNVEGTDVNATGLAPGAGHPGPSVTRGRLPRSVDEIALGSTLADRLHKHVGDEVVVRFDATARTVRVVGEVVGPGGGDYGAGPGSGAVLSYDGIKQLRPSASTDNYFVRLEPGAEPEAFVERILDWQGETHATDDAGLPSAPQTLVDVGRIRNAPYLVAGVLTVLAVATLVHTLLITLRRGRRDLALLRVFGASRTQVRSMVLAQAVVLVGSAAVVSVPLGIALGRVAWRGVATNLGVVVQPVAPLWLAVVPPAALLVGMMAAVGPARRAASTSTAGALRAP